MADSQNDTVNLRHPDGSAQYRDRTVHRSAVPFFVNQGYKVLTSDGRVNSKATSAATLSKENN